MQREVERKRPKRLASLKLAIRRSVDAMPLSMAQRAILSFPMRVKMCISAEGETFNRRKYQAEDIADYPIAGCAGEGEIEDQED